jgi:glycosyltransferase 2 family protein
VTTKPQDLPAPEESRGPWLKRNGLRLAASLVVAGAFIWLLRAGALPMWPDPDVLLKVSWPLVGAYVLLYLSVHFVRAARWYWLLTAVQPVRLRKVLTVSLVGFLAIVALPFRTGEMVRPVLIKKWGGVSAWAAMGTIAAERVIDGLALSSLLFLALLLTTPLDPLPDHIGDLQVPVAIVPGAAYAALALFFTAFFVMGLFYWRRDWARRTTERVIGSVSPRLAHWLAERVEQVAGGLSFLPRARYVTPFLLATLVYWFLAAASSWVLARGCGIEAMTFGQACVILGVLGLGILVPNAPGFFGAFQISIYAGMAMFFPADVVTGPGSAFVALLYACQLGVMVVAALGGALAERLDERGATPPPA